MQIETERALTSLRDVAGVEGTFLMSDSGILQAWDMPDAIRDEVLGEAEVKLARLRQAFVVSGQALDFCTVRFAKYKLCLKSSAAGTICVLTRPDANLGEVRLALKLIRQQLEYGLISEASWASPSP